VTVFVRPFGTMFSIVGSSDKVGTGDVPRLIDLNHGTPSNSLMSNPSSIERSVNGAVDSERADPTELISV
jgi:hypothetical protein